MGIPSTAVQERDDLVSAGVVGLIDAVDRFDYERGIPFEGFARARIRGEIIDELRRLDRRGRAFWKRVRAGGGVAEDSTAALSLDRLVASGGEPAVGDASEPVLEQDLLDDVASALESLPARERDVIRRYYGASRTLRQIGDEMGVSEARVCQLHARAIAQLRRALVTTREPGLAAGAA